MTIMFTDTTHKFEPKRRVALKLSNVLIGLLGDDNDFAFMMLVHWRLHDNHGQFCRLF